MIVLTPAAMAARNGASSTRSRRARSPLTVGRSRCESVLVSPWPGKCFAVERPPFSSTPRTNAATNSETRAGSSPKERVLMIGFSGLLLTSASDEKRNFGVALQRVHQNGGGVHLAAFYAQRRALRLDRERADVLFLDITEK